MVRQEEDWSFVGLAEAEFAKVFGVGSLLEKGGFDGLFSIS